MATIYKRDLDSLIKSDKLKNAIFLYGEESQLLSYYGNKCVEASKCDEVAKMYFTEYDYDKAISLLGQSSLFADGTTLLLRLDKKLPKDELESMLKALKKSNTLIIEFYRKDSRSISEYNVDAKTMANVFLEYISVRFFPLNYSENIAFLQTIFKDSQISDFILRDIFEMQNNNLELSIGEIKKLLHLGINIDKKAVLEHCYGLGSIDIEELGEKLVNKQDVIALAESMTNEGIEEIELIGGLHRYFYRLFLFSSHIKIYGNTDSASILGYKLPVNVEKKTADLALKIQFKKFSHLFEILQKHRDNIFSAYGEKESRILSLLINLQGILR